MALNFKLFMVTFSLQNFVINLCVWQWFKQDNSLWEVHNQESKNFAKAHQIALALGIITRLIIKDWLKIQSKNNVYICVCVCMYIYNMALGGAVLFIKSSSSLSGQTSSHHSSQDCFNIVVVDITQKRSLSQKKYHILYRFIW